MLLQPEPQNRGNQPRVCFLCQSRDHLASHYPRAQCGACGNYGHSRKTCSDNNMSAPYPHELENQPKVCSICQTMDHSTSHCPRAICGGCRNYGHTRWVCPNNNPLPEPQIRISRVRTQGRRSSNNASFENRTESSTMLRNEIPVFRHSRIFVSTNNREKMRNDNVIVPNNQENTLQTEQEFRGVVRMMRDHQH